MPAAINASTEPKAFKGITYPKFMTWRISRWLWRKFGMCNKGMHLFDEVYGQGTALDGKNEHYLVCDCCGTIVYIDAIDTTYTKKINKTRIARHLDKYNLHTKGIQELGKDNNQGQILANRDHGLFTNRDNIPVTQMSVMEGIEEVLND